MTDKHTDALKPCPFCGGDVMPRHALWTDDGDVDAIIHRGPMEWGLASFDCGTADEGVSVASAWNARAPTEATALADEPVAWQWRYRLASSDTDNWSDWHCGRNPTFKGGDYVVEERPLYTSPPAADRNAVLEEALRPFAEMAKHMDDTNERRDAIYCGGSPGLICEVKRSDYHKALRALRTTEAPAQVEGGE